MNSKITDICFSACWLPHFRPVLPVMVCPQDTLEEEQVPSVHYCFLAPRACVVISESELYYIHLGGHMPAQSLVVSCCQWLCTCRWDMSVTTCFALQLVAEMVATDVDLLLGYCCWSSSWDSPTSCHNCSVWSHNCCISVALSVHVHLTVRFFVPRVVGVPSE
jgi:hypothetical protein